MEMNIETLLATDSGRTDCERQHGRIVEIEFSDEVMMEHDVPKPRGPMSAVSSPCRSTSSYSIFNTDWLPVSMSLDPEKKAALVQQSDESSLNSAAYYDLSSDFDPSNWLKTMDATSWGIAAVALATAITHPLLFVAGAITCFTSVKAAGAGYEYFVDSSVAKWCCGWKPCESTCEKDFTNDDFTTASSTRSSAHHPDPEVPVALAPSILLSPLSPDGSGVFPDDWVNSYYPKLETKVIEGESFVGLNALEFDRIFFADSAPYHFKEFQKKRGDQDIHYGKWENIDTTGGISLHPSAVERPLDRKPHSFRERVISFKAKTNSFFGPPYATTKKRQRMLIVSKRLAVLESKTSLEDIPFCDRFFVMERWVVEADKDELYTAHLSTSMQTIFTNSCPFESQIRSKSGSTIWEVGHTWCKMAQQALLLAEQAKLDRLRQDTISEPDDDLTDQHDQEPELIEAVEQDHAESIEMDFQLLVVERNRSRTPLDGLRRSLSLMGKRKSSME
jgi:hypothetical protein